MKQNGARPKYGNEPELRNPLRFPERRGIQEESGGVEENSGEKRDRQNETGFFGIRMVELNRHFGSGGEKGEESGSRSDATAFGVSLIQLGHEQRLQEEVAGSENILRMYATWVVTRANPTAGEHVVD